MKRILCTGIAVFLLLTACSGPKPERHYTHGIYEFTFLAERISGDTISDWEFTYIYNGETVTSGYRILFSLDIFSFHSIYVVVTEKEFPNNTYSDTFPVAICDGGSGKTELTVTGMDGNSATFAVTCSVERVGKQ